MGLRWTIYCHTHIATGRKYIGLTQKTMMHRWNRHTYAAFKRNDRSHFANAIRKHGKDAFSHEVLEVCMNLDAANLAEECWIEFYDTRNHEKGFNLAKGGSHTPHRPKVNHWKDPAFRAAHLPRFVAAGQTAEARAASKAALNTPESKKKRSAAAKASLNSPETIAKREAMRADGSYGVRISKSLRDSLSSEEARARMSEASRSSATPEVRERRSERLREVMSRQETKEKLSVAAKASWARPEFREKILSREASEETRARLSAAATGRNHSNESIRRQRDLYLARSSSCKFCDIPIDGKRSCINGRVACLPCYDLHRLKRASFLRPDKSFI